MTDQGMPLIDIDRDPTHLAAADWLVCLQSTDVSIEDTPGGGATFVVQLPLVSS